MGRLGFNLVRQKEANKNVEAGVATIGADLQNEKNEHVEIGELILAIEERNRKIKNLHLLSIILTIVIIFLSGYILVAQSRDFRSDQAVISEDDNAMETPQLEALRESFDALMRAQSDEPSRNCTAEESARSQLQIELEAERSLRDASILEAKRRYDELQENVTKLQQELESVNSRCQESQEELKAELRRSGVERADLERKLTEASRRLERRSSTGTRQPKATSPVTQSTTPIAITEPPTPAPRGGGLFDTERFRRINDFVKDIETGAARFNFRDFMKKADEVFRF